MPSHIGTLTEKSLHADLKTIYSRPGDRLEAHVAGFVVDILRDDLLIEIQTGGFTPLKRKLAELLGQGYRVHLVHPIPARKWIIKENGAGKPISRRKSPRSGRLAEIFRELVRIPHLLPDPGFAVEAVLVEVEEIRRRDGLGSWRRGGWSLHDQRLLSADAGAVFRTAADYLQFIPAELPRPFTNKALAAAAGIPNWLAQKMTYTLSAAGWLRQTGRERNAHLFEDFP